MAVGATTYNAMLPKCMFCNATITDYIGVVVQQKAIHTINGYQNPIVEGYFCNKVCAKAYDMRIINYDVMFEAFLDRHFPEGTPNPLRLDLKVDPNDFLKDATRYGNWQQQSQTYYNNYKTRFQCRYCKVVAKDSKTLKSHEANCSKNPIAQQNNPGASYTSVGIPHYYNMTSTQQIFRCYHANCGFTTYDYTLFNKHLLAHISAHTP